MEKCSINLICVALCFCNKGFCHLFIGSLQKNITFLLRACQRRVLLAGLWKVSKIKASLTRVEVCWKLLYVFKSCVYCVALITILRLQLSEEKLLGFI